MEPRTIVYVEFHCYDYLMSHGHTDVASFLLGIKGAFRVPIKCEKHAKDIYVLNDKVIFSYCMKAIHSYEYMEIHHPMALI